MKFENRLRGAQPRLESRISALLAVAFLLGLVVLGRGPGPQSTAERGPIQLWNSPFAAGSRGANPFDEDATYLDQGAAAVALEGGWRTSPQASPFVDAWLRRLTRGSPRMLNAYLSLPDPWERELIPILEMHDVPRQFLYLALLESGMNPEARSPAQAVGLWQFTDETARQYGLVVQDSLDQRRDGRLATFAASRYLRDLYTRFGSWELAAAAYNAGPGRVERALEITGADSYWDLMEGRYLPPETRAYVPRFLALVQLASERAAARRAATTSAVSAD